MKYKKCTGILVVVVKPLIIQHELQNGCKGGLGVYKRVCRLFYPKAKCSEDAGGTRQSTEAVACLRGAVYPSHKKINLVNYGRIN